MQKAVSIDLTKYVYVDFEGYLRTRDGKTLLAIPNVEGEAEAAAEILASDATAVKVRLVIEL